MVVSTFLASTPLKTILSDSKMQKLHRIYLSHYKNRYNLVQSCFFIDYAKIQA